MWPFLGLAALVPASPASGQIGASVSVLSDELYRGHSLSEHRAAAVLSLSYDDAGGAYGGLSLTAVPGEALSHVEYAGYVRRLTLAGPALDLGISDAQVTSYKAPRRRVGYQELYAGLVGDELSFHLHYSPNYFDAGAPTLYADLDGAIRPAPQWRLFAHLGALTPLGGPVAPGSRKERYDLTAGVARKFTRAEVSLAWSTTGPVTRRPDGVRQDRDTVALGASYFF